MNGTCNAVPGAASNLPEIPGKEDRTSTEGRKANGTALQGKQHIHFIGIGGSGMYPLAQILHEKGFFLTGSDNNETETLQAVRRLGIPVTLGQKAENIQGADLIVHTAAIMPDNPELCAARLSGVPVLERSELLGLVTSWYDSALCVSGTHGKTTATAMLTQILLEDGKDISAVIGGKLPLIGGGGRCGTSEIMTCEACEFVDTFLKLHPACAVILNIDADHLDYFGTVENIIRSFHRFAQLASRAVLYNGDDANTRKALEGITDKEMISFGFSDASQYWPAEIQQVSGMETRFILMDGQKPICPLTIHVPGRHNVLNAVAACACALWAGASPTGLQKGLAGFFGAGRRFEKLGEVRGVTVADDYAHHPAELTVTLNAAKGLGFQRVWAVFQPFTFSRTAMLLEDFAKSLSLADQVVLTEIMGSREKNTYHIYARDLGEKIPGAVWFDNLQPGETAAEYHDRNFAEIAAYLSREARPGDLVLTLGCGDVYKVAKQLLELLSSEEEQTQGCTGEVHEKEAHPGC